MRLKVALITRRIPVNQKTIFFSQNELAYASLTYFFLLHYNRIYHKQMAVFRYESSYVFSGYLNNLI